MWRTIIRLAPLAVAAYKWWQRRQATKNGQPGAAPRGQGRPGAPGVQDDRLP